MVFLVANASTGIVNVSTDTMEMTDVEAWVAVFVRHGGVRSRRRRRLLSSRLSQGKVKAE